MKTKDVAHHIINWLNDYAEESKLDGFVVGVSGGVDSALTSTLCANTGKPTLCLEMPIHQEKDQVSRANSHTNWLAKNFSNVRVKVVPLDTLYDSFCQLDAERNDNTNTPLSLANTRSRLRMATLYYFASQERFLVAGTGNKVEDFGVGFYTKYGDGGVDVSPIADLMKSQVRELAAHLGVDGSIVHAAPTDGLWDDGRTDESQLGLSYKELEEAMENENSVNRDKYNSIREANLHKMEAIPVCKIPK